MVYVYLSTPYWWTSVSKQMPHVVHICAANYHSMRTFAHISHIQSWLRFEWMHMSRWVSECDRASLDSIALRIAAKNVCGANHWDVNDSQGTWNSMQQRHKGVHTYGRGAIALEEMFEGGDSKKVWLKWQSEHCTVCTQWWQKCQKHLSAFSFHDDESPYGDANRFGISLACTLCQLLSFVRVYPCTVTFKCVICEV